jgi:hypothetical protein
VARHRSPIDPLARSCLVLSGLQEHALVPLLDDHCTEIDSCSDCMVLFRITSTHDDYKLKSMNDRNPEGTVLRGSEWTTMKRDDQVAKLNTTASVPCEGCLNGYGCYNEEHCSSFYDVSYPPPMYEQQQVMPYSNIQSHGPPHPYGSMQPNQPYYNHFEAQFPLQQHFTGFQPQAQLFYYGQPYGVDGPYHQVPTMKAPYHTNRHQGPRANTKGYHFNNSHNLAVDDESFGSVNGPPLMASRFFSEDARRSVAIVKRNQNATLHSIKGKSIICGSMPAHNRTITYITISSLGFIPQVAIYDQQTRKFVHERLHNGDEQEIRAGFKEAIASFQMLIDDEKGSSMLQGSVFL